MKTQTPVALEAILPLARSFASHFTLGLSVLLPVTVGCGGRVNVDLPDHTMPLAATAAATGTSGQTITLVSNLSYPSRIVTNATDILWSSSTVDDQGAVGRWELWKLSKQGGDPVRVLSFPLPPDYNQPPYFIVDDANAYWIEVLDFSTLRIASLMDGTTTDLATQGQIAEFAPGPPETTTPIVYAAAMTYASASPTQGALDSMLEYPTSGEAPVALARPQDLEAIGDVGLGSDLVLDGTSLYWLGYHSNAASKTDHYDILATDTRSATSTILVSDFVVCQRGAHFFGGPIASDGHWLYLWEDVESEGTQLSRVPLAGGTPPTALLSEVQLVPVKDGNDVYFVSVTAAGESTMGLTAGMESWFQGIPTSLWQSTPSKPIASWTERTVRDVAIDATAVYWTDIGAAPSTGDTSHQYDPSHSGTIQKRFR